jgi:hypothetical protein
MTDRLTELFAAPLDEFVTTRNRIAKELRTDGNEAEAAEVAGLRKPTTVVWGLDQLAGAAPDLIDALGKAHDALRGAGSVANMREASDERLRLVGQMVDRAAGILEEAGLGAAESTKERMARTLMATASDPSAEEALRHGRLTSELEPSGFGEVALTASLADGPKPPRTKKADARLAALTDEVATLEEEVTALEKDAKEARRQADQAQRAADSARRRLDQKKEQMAKARAAARS